MRFKALTPLIPFFLLTLFSSGQALATPTNNSRFMETTKVSRAWWYMGAFTALGHLASQTDKKQADCIWNWYFSEPEKKEAILEESMRKHPDHAPSGIVLAHLFKDCGKFKIKLD